MSYELDSSLKMSHWFHRNVLKATTALSFDLKTVAFEPQTDAICRELKESRYKVLQIIPDANHEPATMEAVLNSYLAVLHGMLMVPGETRTSKLRYVMLFKWTHSLLGRTPEVQNDAMFELGNIICNVAIWYMKHAAMIAAKDDITMEQAKAVHTSLRRAAGIFKLIETDILPKLDGKQKEGGDMDPRVVAAYVAQCTAEAQEVTVARAIELKHNPSLISALANETHKLFSDAARVLVSLGPITAQWLKYLQLKSAVYQAYAYCFCGENLLAQDKCGESIAALRESQTCYNRAVELCKEYAKTKGPAPKVHPEEHSFFRRLAPKVKITLEKCERENGFIYHQSIPSDPPELELKATYGLVSPNEFTLPNPSPLWTELAYAAFDGPKDGAPKKDPTLSAAAAKAEGDLPPVPEVNVPQSSNEPKTNSGCVLQ